MTPEAPTKIEAAGALMMLVGILMILTFVAIVFAIAAGWIS